MGNPLWVQVEELIEDWMCREVEDTSLCVGKDAELGVDGSLREDQR